MTEESNILVTQEPAAEYGANSYLDVMTFLHTMKLSPETKEKVGRRLVLEVTAKNLSKAFSRLDYLATLQAGWDGEGALPISRKVLNNAKSVLLISDDKDWAVWMIGPDTNATIGLQSKKTGACISLGSEDYSYYVDMNGKELHRSHVKFTPQDFLNTIREIG